jgi:hypothetical protein
MSADSPEIAHSYVVRGHLADFETTTSHLLRPGQARALLNFAALFHEEIYLTDTALGDSQLIIDSFMKDTSGGLFQQVAGLMRAGILRVLVRDKVVVSGKQLFGPHPSIQEIFEGWQYRDRNVWKGQTGFTSNLDGQRRADYIREAQGLLDENSNAICWYDPDVPKSAFRSTIRELLDVPSSTLSRAVDCLPNVLRRRYYKASKDPWFTNAELWRVLREDPKHESTIILHAHVNQQCFADLTESGQSTKEYPDISLSSFNLELQKRKPLTPSELHATHAPPKNLEELLESAPVKFQTLGIELLEKLSLDQVIVLRQHAKPMFALTRKVVKTEEELHTLRLTYLRAVEKYWGYIVSTFEAASKDKLFEPRPTALLVEQYAPSVGRLRQEFGNGIFAILWRVAFAKAAVFSPVVGAFANRYLGALMLQKAPQNYVLRAAVPSPEWYPPVDWTSQGILRLSSVPKESAEHLSREQNPT